MASPRPDDSGCPDFERTARLDRRRLLEIGALYGLGFSLPELFRARAQAAPATSGTFGRARSVILLYLHGGHAQQETWDPKPDGPYPARGEFGAIATSVPGVRIGELLPLSARMVHKLALIRSLSHANANHVQASLPAMTGHAHLRSDESKGDFPPSPTDFPPFGAVLNHLRPAGKLPTWVQVGPLMRRNNGTVLHGQSPGFFGGKHSPLVIDQDLQARDVRVEAVSANAQVPLLRLQGRKELLQQVDGQRLQWEQNIDVQDLDAYQQKALNLLTSPAMAKAFNLAAEPAAVRDQYGRTQFGQCCLLGRRLAEAGVPMINVHFCRTPVGSWDTHGRHFEQMKSFLCPTFDRAFSALIADLDQRGLLEHTLVLATAEFGRTPRINKGGGRDHWPWVYSVAMAGGGTAPGVVYGASDKAAAYPTSHPHDPCDLAATVYHLLGVPAMTTVYDQTHRPQPLVIGQKIDGLLA
ncbi:MAG: DUF1501 domain-containing protein [Planctomycetota bacterium]|nr:MAG: DUF1501 domain-containing protein [Planctomycetota bacterium]